MARKRSATDEMLESLAAAQQLNPIMPVSVPDVGVPDFSSSIPDVASFVDPTSHEKIQESCIVEDVFPYDVAFRYAFVGSGQGGARLASSFWGHGYRRVALFNTAEGDFNGLPNEIPRYVANIGGAAKNAQYAAQEIGKRTDSVSDLLQRAWGDELDVAFVCVGLGGGTGSGTVKKLVQLARLHMESKGKESRVGVIASLPSAGEGQQVCRNTLRALAELVELKVSPLVLIDNARINKLYRPGMTKLFAVANSTISSLFHLFNQIAASKGGLITFDQSELAQLLSDGVCVMGAAKLEAVTSPTDVSEAIRQQVSNNVLAEVDLTRGRKGACIFVGPQECMDNLNLDVFEGGFRQLNHMLKEDGSVVHRGVYVGGGSHLQVYVMISGLQLPIKTLEHLSRVANPSGVAGGFDAARFLGVGD